MEGGRRGDRTPHAADHADGRRRDLALIPISHEIFWGPMAYAMMGGIVVGTALTLLFLPALYVAWFRIKEPKRDSAQSEVLAESGAA